ncbi:MAG: hypothetical protein ACE5LS_04930 [Thermoplasmata archaeon]
MGLFGKGKMEVTLDKYSYEPGETITGYMSFTLKKPVEARGVFTHLIGEERGTESYILNGRQRTRTVWNEVYSMKFPLDGEREYSGGGTYDIDMHIPGDVLGTPPEPPGPPMCTGCGEELQTGSKYKYCPYCGTRRTRRPPRGGGKTMRWWVKANLDRPHALDVKRKVQITIG